ncbi:MAG: type II secretion system F family protein [Halanaerobiales bacterium]
MAIYSYKAIASDGKNKKGTIEANSRDSAIMMLKDSGLVPLDVNEQGVLQKDLDFNFGKLVKPKDLSLFCRQFVGVLNAGVTVLSALDLMSQQTENKYLRKAITEVHVSVEKGESLASAMSQHPKIFPSLLINMVEAGELTGSLELSFKRMAIQFEKDAKIKQTVKKAVTYPILVSVVAVIVVTVLITFVVPTFISMFQQMDAELPTLTKVLLGISDFIKEKWWLLLIIITGIIVGLKVFGRTEQGKEFFGNLMLKLPLFGKLTIKVSAARFTRTLSTLLASGISLLDALEIVSKVITNHSVSQHIIEAREQVSRGVPLSKPIKEKGIMPPMVTHMVKIGEDTGSLEEVLNKVADVYDEEVETTVTQLMTLMEPAIIIVLASIVLFILLSIVQPMFQMYSEIQ